MEVAAYVYRNVWVCASRWFILHLVILHLLVWLVLSPLLLSLCSRRHKGTFTLCTIPTLCWLSRWKMNEWLISGGCSPMCPVLKKSGWTRCSLSTVGLSHPHGCRSLFVIVTFRPGWKALFSFTSSWIGGGCVDIELISLLHMRRWRIPDKIQRDSTPRNKNDQFYCQSGAAMMKSVPPFWFFTNVELRRVALPQLTTSSWIQGSKSLTVNTGQTIGSRDP